MDVERLGELTADSSIKEWLVSKEVGVNYFPNTSKRFILKDIQSDSVPDEFTAAVTNFLDLTLKDRETATPYVFKNYTEFVEAVGEDDVDVHIENPSDVWKHIQPSEIHTVRRAYGDRKVYAHITANCAWEHEHGLQTVYREGKKLSRVSDQAAISPTQTLTVCRRTKTASEPL